MAGAFFTLHGGKSSMNASIAIETITPNQAAKWLEDRFEGQRHVRTAHVQRLASMIHKGEWRLTSDAVTLIKGKLGNGQHRCEAIVLANQPCDALVLRTTDEKLFDVLDSGIARSVADVLTQHGSGFAAIISSAARTAIAYNRGLITAGKIGSPRNKANSPIQDIITRADVIEFCDEHQEKLATYAKAASRWYGEAAILSPSMATAFIYIASRKGERKALDFMKTVFTGDARDAAFDVRERLIKNKMSKRKLPAAYIFGLLIKAFRAYLNDERPQVYKIMAKEEYPVL
jgi:hypothetical protein